MKKMQGVLVILGSGIMLMNIEGMAATYELRQPCCAANLPTWAQSCETFCSDCYCDGVFQATMGRNVSDAACKLWCQNYGTPTKPPPIPKHGPSQGWGAPIINN